VTGGGDFGVTHIGNEQRRVVHGFTFDDRQKVAEPRPGGWC